MKLGIAADGFIEWAGGVDLLRTIAGSLAAASEPVEVHVLLPLRGRRVWQAELRHRWRVLRGKARPTRPVMTVEAFRQTFLAMPGAVQVHLIDQGERALLKAAERLGLHGVLPSMRILPDGTPFPWMGYTYDFQHRHLPHLFSDEVRAARDRNFARMLTEAPAVLVNARSVVDDIRQFVPAATARVVAMPFCAAPQPEWFALDTRAARARHGVGTRYFVVCNQFWRHKDHETAFRALALAGTALGDAELVCTGTPSDPRFPEHSAALTELIRALGLTSRVRVLGLVPKDEQLALMAGSQAVLQPTLFEGGPGGGSVYDAVALGVPCIVSDIPVNRELDEPVVRFFRTSDAEDLTRQMVLTPWREPTAPHDGARLLADGQTRARRCGDVLVSAIREMRNARPAGGLASH